MNELVLDASVVVKWFHSEGEGQLEAARALRDRFEAGELRVLVPALLWLELVNVAARRWGWDGRRLAAFARSLGDLGFESIEPDLAAVARWAAAGLTAYDAAYVAVAEQAGVRLLTEDAEIVRVAGELAEALGDVAPAPEPAATRPAEPPPESAFEVERKWLVDEPPAAALAVAGEEIDQGYLAIAADGTEVRLRRRGERRYLTVKSAGGLVRGEREVEIGPEQFEALWPATTGRRVQKRRRVLDGGGGARIELDVYAGSLLGLIVAEVEFADSEAAAGFDAPGWFGREVTGEVSYKNQRLAVDGLPPP